MKIAATALCLALMAGTALATTANRIEGGNGPDTLIGTSGEDFITGGHGPDLLKGKAGDDILWTGKGGAHEGDTGIGGPGDDRIHNYASGNTAGVTRGGPGDDRCQVDQADIDRGVVSGCEIVTIGP